MRVVPVLLALLVAGFVGAIEARGEASPPVFELLGPADGATVVISSEEQKWATYHVRVTFPADYAGSVSENPLDPRLPIGTYTYCASATDAAGHKATSCAPYRITSA